MNLVPYKQWVADEAMRLGRAPNTIQSNVLRGKYRLIRVRANKRVMFVDIERTRVFNLVPA